MEQRERALQAEIETVQRRFADWRQSDGRGRRIPDELWRMAVRLAHRQGVHRTGLQLRLNSTALKRWFGKLDMGTLAAAAKKPVQFVELALPERTGAGGPSWVVEIEDHHGTRMRVTAGSGGALDVA